MQLTAISIKQPWATMIADGRKTIELRSWRTKPKRDVLICSSASPKIHPAGFALCLVDIASCSPWLQVEEDAACTEWREGLFAWHLENVRRITPFSVKGKLSFFQVDVPCAIMGDMPPTDDDELSQPPSMENLLSICDNHLDSFL